MPRETMLWLGIHFPLLPLEALQRDASMLAVCHADRILLASADACAAGITPGMNRAAALALLPSLQLHARDPIRETQWQALAALCALRFTPMVSLQSIPAMPRQARAAQEAHPAGLLIELQASLRLFGGRERLIAALRADLRALGLSFQMACAPTATGAWLMARHQDGLCAEDQASLHARLAGLPVRLLDTAAQHLDILENLGAHTLKQLSLLPRAGLARRFGPSLIEELDLAFGRIPEPRQWFSAPPVFQARLELPMQAEDAQSLLAGASRLLVGLCAWLSAQHAVTRAIMLLACHEDALPTEIPLQPADATADADRLGTLLREKLAILRLPAPVHRLELHCEQISPHSPSAGNLFPMPDSAREGLGRLIERLQARLGRDQVLGLLPQADHRPEHAHRLERVSLKQLIASEPVKPRKRTTRLPWAAKHASTSTLKPAPSSMAEPAPSSMAEPAPPSMAEPTPPWMWGGLPRPLWLLDEPRVLGERDGRPCWPVHRPLQLLAGPERIETGWWDGSLVERDYFIASDDTDMLLWIYRERRAERGEASAAWFLQGRFG